MTDRTEHVGGTYRPSALAIIVSLSVAIIGATYLMSDKGWWFESETVVVEKTVITAPWWADAIPLIFLLLLVWAISYGVRGGFPRP